MERTTQATLRIASRLALTAHLFLLTTVTVWNTWIAPPQAYPRIVAIIALGLPLLLILRGMLRNKPDSYHLACILALIYLALGITNIAGGARLYGWLQTFGSVALFAGSALSIKFASR